MIRCICTLLVLIAPFAAQCGDDVAALRAKLQSKVTLDFVNKPFDEAAKALCEQAKIKVTFHPDLFKGGLNNGGVTLYAQQLELGMGINDSCDGCNLERRSS